MRLGAAFDPPADGGSEPALTREGGHSHNRIVHAGGDQSGAEVQRTLDESAVAAGVEVLDRGFALDLLVGTSPSGRRQACGVRVAILDDAGDVVSSGIVHARAVVAATGGFGQVFAATSNPSAVTGDGLALALRAGLPARDVEFVQFHPTVLYTGPDATGQQALVSEAVRGEGAILFDAAGERVMVGVHPLEDLAPRDVVAAAITERMTARPRRCRRPRVPRRDVDGRAVLHALPVDHRGVPRGRHRPGARAHPGRPGRALRLRWCGGRPLGAHLAARLLRGRRGRRRPACTARTGWRRTP